jgi:RNA polymerase sigma factor (sigma-70 family)
MTAAPTSLASPVAALRSDAHSKLTDSDLLRKVALTHDEAAFRTLVTRYATPVHALACRILGQSALAEDATQEAFLVIWQCPEGYDSARGSVRSWLMGIAHHRAVDRVRREQSQRNLGAAIRGPASLGDIAEEVAQAVDLPGEKRAVRRALERIPQAQRRVIELMYFDGLSQQQIAAALGIPLGTVKSRCLLGMRKLRKELLPAEGSVLW